MEPPDYNQANGFLDKFWRVRTDMTVSVEWINGHDSCFWYRKESVAGTRFTFTFVDAARQLVQPAFNHHKLADALNERGIQAEASGFPFRWINASSDGQYMRFRIQGKSWEFWADGRLVEYAGSVDLGGHELRPLAKEKPSARTRDATAICFVNQTRRRITLSWIDWDCNVKPYTTVEAGQSYRVETWVRHVWRVEREGTANTKELLASFMAAPKEAQAIIEQGMCSPTQPLDDDEPPAPSSPGGQAPRQRSIVVRDSNVWLLDTDDYDYQLSDDATEKHPFDEHKAFISPDQCFAVVWQYTPEEERLLYRIESSPEGQLQPRLHQSPYLRAGDRVRVDRPRLFDLEKATEVPTDNALFPNPYEMTDMGWSNDSSTYRFLYNQRGHQTLRVIAMDTSGSTRAAVDESSRTFIDYYEKQYYHEVEDTQQLIWASERDGWNHLYLFDLATGQLANQITKGEWVVHSVEKVDDRARQVWLKALGYVPGQDPYYAQLIRVNFDGSGLTVLTKGTNGTHSWQWSPDATYLVDSWSRLDLPPQTVVRDGATGEQLLVLEEGSCQPLLDIGWTPAERFAAPGRDGKTLIYGAITRPSHFDATKKYPVIEQIYAGPTQFSAPTAFASQINDSLYRLVELGFVLVQIDGMGTNWRSKAFHDHCYKNLRDAGFPDRMAWMRAAAQSRSWMDLSRVGIFGGSAGGQNAVAALLWHGDFYKAAVADCGSHDNRLDKIWWSELFMGWPVDASYLDSSNIVHAARLQGALMLIVGEMDTNVDPASTMQLVHALNKARKDYDLLVMPGEEHGIGLSDKYSQRRLRDFFVSHLMVAMKTRDS